MPRGLFSYWVVPNSLSLSKSLFPKDWVVPRSRDKALAESFCQSLIPKDVSSVGVFKAFSRKCSEVISRLLECCCFPMGFPCTVVLQCVFYFSSQPELFPKPRRPRRQQCHLISNTCSTRNWSFLGDCVARIFPRFPASSDFPV